ncbi:Myosin-binding protein 7-like protein [Drosera capensis]
MGRKTIFRFASQQEKWLMGENCGREKHFGSQREGGAGFMDSENGALSTPSFVRCLNCGCSSLALSSSGGGSWIRSVKRKFDELEERSGGRFYIPGLEPLRVARVDVNNECAALRETVSSQQNTIQDLYVELDEERNASSSAANEAMSMILRLQREKAEVQMEARQFKRFSEEKMTHDAQEIAALEDLLYKREQTIQSLTCEVQAYKHRMMSYGLTEAEAEGMKGGYSWHQSFSDFGGPVDSPSSVYPPLKCDPNDTQMHSEFDDDAIDFEMYPFGETPWSREHLKKEFRINQLERTSSSNQLDGDFSGSRNIMEKIIVGYSPRTARHSRRFSTDSSNSFLGFGREFPDLYPDSPGQGTSFKKMDCVVEELRKTENASEVGDDASDRAYPGPPFNKFFDAKVPPAIFEDYMITPRGSINPADLSDVEIKKLYLRLQALEADRESLKQTIISMQTDKAQLVLLREIAQHLCKDMSGEKRLPLKKPSILGIFSFMAIFKWVWTFIFRRKKARQAKYTFGLSPNNAGLLMLLDKSLHARHWRPFGYVVAPSILHKS